jgi:hypothetical protein
MFCVSASFPAWALDPARTLEERYGTERLIECMLPKLYEDADASWNENYEAARLRHKVRSLNPAYQPGFSVEQVEQVAASLGAAKVLNINQSDDRPLRDLAFLQFVPQLEELWLASNEITDFSWLRFSSCLRRLYANSTPARDLRPIGELGRLEHLHIWPKCPWPDMRGLERLTSLIHFYFSGNKLALRAIPSLPNVRTVEIHNSTFQLPVRDLHDLPEMPELRVLHLDNTWRLDGIERSPKLLNLEVYGYFDDLTPLLSLSQLTHLTISGGEYESLAPLATLPELRWLKVRRQEPQDYAPLAEAPRLHAIEAEICEVTAMEVATLNAALSSWSEDFGAPSPRPLGPLRLLVGHEKKKPVLLPGVEERSCEENPHMGGSEIGWFVSEVRQRLAGLLGEAWGRKGDVYGLRGNCHVTLSRLEDIERIPRIIETLRRLLASCRYKWSFLLIVDSMARYERDFWEDDDENKDDEFDAEGERANWEDQKERERERQEFQERAYRYKLKREEGAEIRPEEFAPKLESPMEVEERAEETPSYDTGARFSLYANLFEHALVVNRDDVSMAEYLTGLKADFSELPPAEE